MKEGKRRREGSRKEGRQVGRQVSYAIPSKTDN